MKTGREHWLFRKPAGRYLAYLLAVEVLGFVLIPLIPLPQPIYSFFSMIFTLLKGQFAGDGFLSFAFAIFFHNLVPATLDMVPFFGILMFIIQTIVTGLALSAEAITTGQSGVQLALRLLSLPYSWIELSAYALSLSEGIMLINRGIEGRFWEEFRGSAVRVWLLVVAILFVAAAFETATIYLGFPLDYLTWIPFLMIAATVLVALRKGDASGRREKVRRHGG